MLTGRGSRRRRLAVRILQRGTRPLPLLVPLPRDLATRQEACNPNYAIVRAGGSFLLRDMLPGCCFEASLFRATTETLLIRVSEVCNGKGEKGERVEKQGRTTAL